MNAATYPSNEGHSLNALILMGKARTERLINEQWARNMRKVFEPLDEAVCLAFHSAPATLHPKGRL